MRAAAALRLGVTALAACGAPGAGAPAALGGGAPVEGLAIAIHAGRAGAIAVIDDRRAIEVAGGALLLDRIDPSADLQSLLIEPLGPAGALQIAQCARAQLTVDAAPGADARDGGAAGVASPLVACAVTGPPGRHLVRVHHVATSISFRAQHEIAVTGAERAAVSTRFAIATPAWGRGRAEVALYDGAPGAEEPPRELARGSIALDGGTAVLSLPRREVPARLVTVYDGAVRGAGVERTHPDWAQGSRHEVRVLLELEDPALRPGPVHVRFGDGDGALEVRSAYAPAAPADGDPAPGAAASAAATSSSRRIPLWIDRTLRGTRGRAVARGEGGAIIDRLELTLANLGADPREVWIEEPLRPARRRTILRARPRAPEIVGDTARLLVLVLPGAIERVAFTVRASF